MLEYSSMLEYTVHKTGLTRIRMLIYSTRDRTKSGHVSKTMHRTGLNEYTGVCIFENILPPRGEEKKNMSAYVIWGGRVKEEEKKVANVREKKKKGEKERKGKERKKGE
jgi:hypothetical protein